jgi:hypothetical protein
MRHDAGPDFDLESAQPGKREGARHGPVRARHGVPAGIPWQAPTKFVN